MIIAICDDQPETLGELNEIMEQFPFIKKVHLYSDIEPSLDKGIHGRGVYALVKRGKAFREINEHEALLAGQGTTMQYMKWMFKQPDKLAFETELAWHGQLIAAFNSLVH